MGPVLRPPYWQAVNTTAQTGRIYDRKRCCTKARLLKKTLQWCRPYVIRGMDLALLVNGHDDSAGGWVHGEADDILDLGGESRILGLLASCGCGGFRAGAPPKCAAPRERRGRRSWPSPGRSNALLRREAQCRSALPPRSRSYPTAVPCLVCGSAPAGEHRPRVRQSAAASARPKDG